MFKKILIANRGEIACRIIKTADRLGIATVAVYSEADRKALHVSFADEALLIGPAPAAQSYLSIENIIAACRASGAQAVHPGYGFLSERAEFARALTREGIVLIGPNADAIETMGDKIAARARAEAAGVAIVPGSPAAMQDIREAQHFAEAIGYPVMIKASAGGGGKGLRIAQSATQLAEEFPRAASEAQSAFGDGRVFIEKFIETPRHIEVQILGDKHGNLIHLGERECSIQRRHQKVIEEAPSAFVDDAMRAAMGAQAIALAKAVHYDSAGTVEFIVGPDRSFYFLEMNTRLQVEHAVTECITGIDLVEQMIRIAAGERLSLRQEDISLSGHAVESRIYAENPQRGFLPATGRLTRYRPPSGTASGSGLRVDSGVAEGGEISIHYDPMIAKLITHSQTRASAIEIHADALDRFSIDGVANNLLFLSAIMGHPRWLAADVSTHFIEEAYPHGFRSDGDASWLNKFAYVAASIDSVMEMRAANAVFDLKCEPRQVSVFLGERRLDFGVLPIDKAHTDIWFDDEHRTRAEFHWEPGKLLWVGRADGTELVVQVRPTRDGFVLSTHGMAVEARVLSRRAADLAALLPAKGLRESVKTLLCPMPGLLKRIDVTPGQHVVEGDPLYMMEAMKMEHVVRAPYPGVVMRIHAQIDTLLGVDAPVLDLDEVKA
jgi:propionyl-CoA carboxylase alpha chain